MENGSFSLDVACSQSTDRADNTQDTVAVVQPSVGASITAAEHFYTEKSQSLKALVVMCRGLLDVDDQPLFDIAVEPWCSVKAAVVKPNSREYKEEIERRLAISVSYSGNNHPRSKPRPKQWTMQKVLEWLDNNPVTNEEDVTFLTQKVTEHKTIVEEAATVARNDAEQLERQWSGKNPYLRLIHALVDHDDAKRLFLVRYDLDNSRLQVPKSAN
jgi:hypothetical protein